MYDNVKENSRRQSRLIAIQPPKVLDHKQLNRRLVSSLLYLIEPELKYSHQLTGEVSMWVDKSTLSFAVVEAVSR